MKQSIDRKGRRFFQIHYGTKIYNIRTVCVIARYTETRRYGRKRFDDGKLIMIQEDSGEFSFPGGTVEETDETPVITAIREFYEETMLHETIPPEEWPRIWKKLQTDTNRSAQIIRQLYKILLTSRGFVYDHGNLHVLYLLIDIPWEIGITLHNEMDIHSSNIREIKQFLNTKRESLRSRERYFLTHHMDVLYGKAPTCDVQMILSKKRFSKQTDRKSNDELWRALGKIREPLRQVFSIETTCC